MSFINYASKELIFKIAFCGPGMSGKTSNLKYLFEHLPQDQKESMVTLKEDPDRTLFFDFLPLFLGPWNGFQTRLHLYTIPGQELYEANRRVIFKGIDGIVFVADSASDRLEDNRLSWKNLKKNLEYYEYDLFKIPIVFQYNKRDLKDAVPVEELSLILNELNAPEFTAEAIHGLGVGETLQFLIEKILSQTQI